MYDLKSSWPLLRRHPTGLVDPRWESQLQSAWASSTCWHTRMKAAHSAGESQNSQLEQSLPVHGWISRILVGLCGSWLATISTVGLSRIALGLRLGPGMSHGRTSIPLRTLLVASLGVGRMTPRARNRSTRYQS